MPKYKELNILKGRIREKKKTYAGLSGETGIPINTLSNKINGHSLFDIVEVSKLCVSLEIQPKSIPLFFSLDCETQQSSQETTS